MEILLSLASFLPQSPNLPRFPMTITGPQGLQDSILLIPLPYIFLCSPTINFRLPVLTFKAYLHFESVLIASLIFSMSHSLSPIPNSGHSSKFLHIPGTNIPASPSPISPTIYQAFPLSLISPNSKKFERTLL